MINVYSNSFKHTRMCIRHSVSDFVFMNDSHFKFSNHGNSEILTNLSTKCKTIHYSNDDLYVTIAIIFEN